MKISFTNFSCFPFLSTGMAICMHRLSSCYICLIYHRSNRVWDSRLTQVRPGYGPGPEAAPTGQMSGFGLSGNLPLDQSITGFLTQLGHERVVFAAMHGRDLLYSAMLGLAGKPVKRREFITLAPARQPARCRLSRSPSAQREAQMIVRLPIIGGLAAILMLPTTL